MNIIEAFATKNKCYQIGTPLKPRGIMLHSVGCAQPSAAVFARNFNQYQPGGQSVCVHAFVQADGTVYQTLPWEMRGWHCGGAANNTHIGIEMAEPSASMSYAESAEQITGTYHAAVELFAKLCETYGLDPLADGVIIGHAEGHRRGVASNHADPEALWQQYGMGYTMDGFRRDVAETMNENDNGMLINSKMNLVSEEIANNNSKVERITENEEINIINSNRNNQRRNIKKENTASFVINEYIVSLVVDLGFEREYVIKSLEKNELCHATAAYYLFLNYENLK